MTTPRKLPGVAFWATVVVVVALTGLVMYALTAPAISLWVFEGIGHGILPQWMGDVDFVVCWPLRWIVKNCPVALPEHILYYYSGLFWH